MFADPSVAGLGASGSSRPRAVDAPETTIIGPAVPLRATRSCRSDWMGASRTSGNLWPTGFLLLVPEPAVQAAGWRLTELPAGPQMSVSIDRARSG